MSGRISIPFVSLALFALAVSIPATSHAIALETPVTDSVAVVETLKVLHDETDADADNHFWAAINRLNLSVNKGPFNAGIRYDAESYFEKEQYGVKYLLEKAYGQYEGHGFFFRAGDFYNRMGDGLTLSVLKRDEFGQDNTIRGGIAQWGDTGGHVEVRAVGGAFNECDDLSFTPDRITQNEPAFDEQDTVYGGQILVGAPGWGFVSGRALAGKLLVDETIGTPEREKDDNYQLIGAGFQWLNLGGHGTVSGEYAWYELEDRKKDIDSVETEGRAAYANVNLFFGPLTLLIEGQDYYRWTYPYAEPPILEFEKQTFGHAPDKEDIIGGRGLAEVVVPVIDVSVYGNYYRSARHEHVPSELAMHYDENDNPNNERLGEWVEHSYGGFEKMFEGGAYILGSGGYREESGGRWVHGEFDAGMPVAKNHEITVENRWRDFHGMTGLDAGREYGTWSVSPTWNWTPWLSLTGRYEFSDEPLAQGTSAGGETDDKEDFWSGEAILHAGEHADLSLFYGRIKGGLVCSGGVCREVPPFEGARADLTVKF